MISQPITGRATALSITSSKGHPTNTPRIAGTAISHTGFHDPPLRLIRKPMTSAAISSGRTSPTLSLAPKAFAISTTVSVAVPASPALDKPMHKAPMIASVSVKPSPLNIE